jgi:hypothetical protein
MYWNINAMQTQYIIMSLWHNIDYYTCDRLLNSEFEILAFEMMNYQESIFYSLYFYKQKLIQIFVKKYFNAGSQY